MLAGEPQQGGASWAVLQYVLGLERLGHEVMFVEPVATANLGAAESYFRVVLAQSGVRRAALLVQGERRTAGVPFDELVAWAGRADVLLNLSGVLTDESLLDGIAVRVYVDLDPAFSQLWHEQGVDVRFAGHTHYATVGQALGRPTCPIPTCGFDWIPTVPPVVLDRWQPADAVTRDAWTTVGNWRSYGSITHDGVFYGQKAHSLRSLIDLPEHTEEHLVLALAIDPEERRDLAELARRGWQLLDPAQVAGSPAEYASFVCGSKGELGVAKAGYVVSRSGWFSDRSVSYLASGRPVVAQDTGFTDFIESGNGLLPFTTTDDAARAIEDVTRDYPRHARAARRLAAEHFDSDRVLTRLLEAVGAA
jgi:hypothetical protein